MSSEKEKIQSSWTLKGRNFVVTGGSNGIGLATVKSVKANGFQVAGAIRQREATMPIAIFLNVFKGAHLSATIKPRYVAFAAAGVRQHAVVALGDQRCHVAQGGRFARHTWRAGGFAN